MSPNTALLHQTLTHIETHPDQWHQLDWATRTECGTAYCFAGWAVQLARPDAEPDFDGGRSTSVVIVDGVPRSIEVLASDLLGLDIDQSEDLFACENTLDDLRRIVRELTGQECPR